MINLATHSTSSPNPSFYTPPFFWPDCHNHQMTMGNQPLWPLFLTLRVTIHFWSVFLSWLFMVNKNTKQGEDYEHWAVQGVLTKSGAGMSLLIPLTRYCTTSWIFGGYCLLAMIHQLWSFLLKISFVLKPCKPWYHNVHIGSQHWAIYMTSNPPHISWYTCRGRPAWLKIHK